MAAPPRRNLRAHTLFNPSIRLHIQCRKWTLEGEEYTDRVELTVFQPVTISGFHTIAFTITDSSTLQELLKTWEKEVRCAIKRMWAHLRLVHGSPRTVSDWGAARQVQGPRWCRLSRGAIVRPDTRAL